MAQALFAFWQYNFSEASFNKQQAIAEQAAKDADTQAQRLIGAAERLAHTNERSTSNSERAVRDSLAQGREALQQATDANKRTAQLVREAQEVFAAQAFPIVKITGYQFHSDPSSAGKQECSAPPWGIAIKYTNKSSIPVLTKTVKLRLSHAGREVIPELTNIAPRPVAKIMTANEEISSGVGGIGFSTAYASRRDSNAPPIVAKLELLYQAIPTRRCYKYEGDMELLGICTIPGQIHYNVVRESVSVIPCP